MFINQHSLRYSDISPDHWRGFWDIFNTLPVDMGYAYAAPDLFYCFAGI